MKRINSLHPTGLLIAVVLLIIVTLVVLPACEEKSDCVEGDVAFYLLESYETTDQTCAILNTSVVLKEHPLIGYSDMESYNSNTHVFKISEDAKDTMEELEYSVFGLPFALLADDQLIYTGYFWPSYSSASCQWIVIDPLMFHGDNELKVELGYPGLIDDGTEIPDERNNPLILDIFRRDGKLID